MLEDPESEVTVRILREVYNGAMKGLVFTTEVFGDFKGEWGIPTLDTVWKLFENGGGKKFLGYKFYKKPISSRWVTPFRSAQGLNGKISTLSQDVFRVLSNSNWTVTSKE